jgi:CheY-like chemotaxis protein
MKTVLIVDDDRIMTSILSVWLKRMGYAVLIEFDVPEALRMMKSRTVDAIILDLDMPSGCGTEVIERLKTYQRTGTIPIVVLSANSDPKVMTRVRAIGADEFIVKPTSSEHIAKTLDDLFAEQELRQRAKQAKDVDAIKQHQPRPVVRYKGSALSLESLVSTAAFKGWLRKAAH